MCGVIKNPRKDQLRLPPWSHEDLYVLVLNWTSEIFRSACVLKQRRVWSGLHSGTAGRLLLGLGMAPGEGAAMPLNVSNGPST